MEGPTPPINIASRNTSVSPPGQQASNLTSALQRASTIDKSAGASNTTIPTSVAYKSNAARKDSIGASMAQWGNGTKPITVAGSNRDKQRRESLAGSLVGGMSWGGVSVGSWIRDDILMTGTSPFTLQSPSYHSSSYLPKLEANFMRDFACCGVTLPSLHDLLQHYEEAHAQKSPQPPQRTGQTGQMSIGDNRTGMPGGVRNQGQQNQQSNIGIGGNQNRGISSPRPNQNQQTSNHMTSPAPQHPQTQRGGFGSQNDLPDLDTVEDMEMDDPLADNAFQDPRSRDSPMQGRFGQQNQGRLTPLNLSMLQGHQGLRNSQPGTPVTPGRPLQNNPTVSSVNTPTLVTHQLQQQQNSGYRGTPDSSTPGTPAEIDESIIGEFGDMSMLQNNALIGSQGQFPGYGGGNDMLNLCIDEPAKRLFSPTGGFNQQQNMLNRLGSQPYGPNSQIAQRIREQQLRAGVPDTIGLLPNEEPKPFRCPVIGCEKAYKNQNGLKYHKAHGHNNQQLHDNADGTFSIVNPETCTPYPGALGMEKEKPFRCEVCGKRYKNLNGLKYHRSHSPPCNPELQLAAGRNLGVGGVMQGQNINVAGAGLPGIGEEGL
ncbi:C2H2 transcription factor [Blastomyces dermatitidis ER-3]|uniref:C2H2 transcription factor n=1 Tax=Ajellomyces dermatitidis (strain ER-3 / ATCC MYA-2586) TaxID=559297 RepID=A0ABP2EZU2_AJEDR|nr:C2H2 transcription factor [Blastomyces dermatitidis ER-3]EEQ89831.1 C2H2 transcription factor [Blastomyces dermatitidis ER-3]